MNIKSIKVNGLFNAFNHEIIFSSGGIRIIIGENGIGKTAMLKILEAIFNNDVRTLLSIDYHSIIVDFATRKETWTITKEPNEKGTAVHIKSNIHNKDDQVLNLLNKHSFPRRMFVRISDNEWIDRRFDMVCTKEDIYNRYGFDITENDDVKLKKWFVDRLNDNKIKLINAQRLFQKKKEGQEDSSFQETVSLFSKSLVEILNKDDSAFSSISQKLDRTFANRLLKTLNKRIKKDIDINEINDIFERLTTLSNYRAQLSRVGIIAQEEDDVVQNIKEGIDRNILTVLSLYVDDNKEKLECYRETANKLEILLNIINRRFRYKRLVVDKTKGFVIKSNDVDDTSVEDSIPVNKLSSGEQNELIMFYDLLFNCDSKDLVLIDEPEISLHLRWQQSLIDDLRNICANNKLSLLIATHSPDIIGDNWNIVQTLSGEEK